MVEVEVGMVRVWAKVVGGFGTDGGLVCFWATIWAFCGCEDGGANPAWDAKDSCLGLIGEKGVGGLFDG